VNRCSHAKHFSWTHGSLPHIDRLDACPADRGITPIDVVDVGVFEQRPLRAGQSLKQPLISSSVPLSAELPRPAASFSLLAKISAVAIHAPIPGYRARPLQPCSMFRPVSSHNGADSKHSSLKRHFALAKIRSSRS
jgi:hypothetical protein